MFCELTFSPLARLMALKGRRTLRTRRIFTTLMALDLQPTRDQRAQPAIKKAASLSKGGVGRRWWGGGGKDTEERHAQDAVIKLSRVKILNGSL